MTEDPSVQPWHRGVALFFGYLLMVIGGLFALTAGICSIVLLSDGRDMLPLVLLIGGSFLALGVGLAIGGWFLIRRKKAAEEEE